MRQLLILFLAFGLLISPVWAQNNDADTFTVTDVSVDVTADNAAQARDQAIIEAQHAAFEQLLDRLGAEPAIATKLSDDDLATLVQSFEVQSERTSSVRYIATMTVQFRPGAVRSLVGNRIVSAPVVRSKPLVILPVLNNDGRHILWEEGTKWRAAWEKSTHGAGLVPLILPVGDLDDVAVISTDEAVSGKTSSIKAISDKYQATGAVVVTLNNSDASTTEGLRIDVQRYNAEGTATSLTHITLPAPADKNTLDSLLAQGIKQIRDKLEKDWRQESKNAVKSPTSLPSPIPALAPSPIPEEAVEESGPTVTLPVMVPLVSLTEWAQIRGRLNSISSIHRTNVITLARGATNIEISFSGTLEELQAALLQQSLSLTKNMASGGWVLRPSMPGDTL